jgi:hypothetical protein
MMRRPARADFFVMNLDFVLNRPFDDQSDLLVRLQTEAKLHVQELIRGGEISLVWSAIMNVEN